MGEKNTIPLSLIQTDINSSILNTNSLDNMVLSADTDIEMKNLLQWSKNHFNSFHDNIVSKNLENQMNELVQIEHEIDNIFES